MSRNTDFISPGLIKTRTGISDSIDEKNILPQIKVAQDIYIQPAIGSTLYARLQAATENNTLTANEVILIDMYITDALVWYVMSLLPFSLGYQFFSKGVLQKTAEESNAPSRADLELISNQYKNTAEFYKQRLISYLRQNYILYQEYFTTAVALDTIFPERKAYTSPIYLGGVITYDESFSGGNNATTLPTYIKELTPIINLSSFTVSELSGRTLISVSRGGLAKGITSTATADTAYLQVNGTLITLPTGDLTAGELFIFEYR